MPTPSDAALRQHLLSLLKGGNAHADFEAAVKDLPADVRGTRPQGAEHSPWEVLEHLRIAQWDILEFSRNPHHQSPEFPRGILAPHASSSERNGVEQECAGVPQGFEGDVRSGGR